MKKIIAIILLIVLCAAAVPAAASKYTTVAPVILDGLEWGATANGCQSTQYL